MIRPSSPVREVIGVATPVVQTHADECRSSGFKSSGFWRAGDRFKTFTFVDAHLNTHTTHALLRLCLNNVLNSIVSAASRRAAVLFLCPAHACDKTFIMHVLDADGRPASRECLRGIEILSQASERELHILLADPSSSTLSAADTPYMIIMGRTQPTLATHAHMRAYACRPRRRVGRGI